MSLHGVISRHRLRAVPDVVSSAPAPLHDAAVETLYREDGTRLWRAVRAYAADSTVADDAVAEAFAQLLRRGEEVREPKKWVWRAAFKIAAGELQRRRRDVPESPAEVGRLDAECSVDLHRALAVLSPSQRAAVVLHDYAGYSASESARIVGSTEAAMRVHLMRGRRRLRELL
jgi:RNA polymerase sigma-70 factor (ECF subfamily)